MKKYLFLVVTALFFTATSFSQLRKIPADVTEAFKNKYPQATNVSWSDKLSSFQASFTNENEKLEASFNSKGEWKKTEKDLDVTKLPSSVKEGFNGSKYNTDWSIKGAQETEENNGKFEYRLLIEKSALQKKYVYMNRDGQVLREALTL